MPGALRGVRRVSSGSFLRRVCEHGSFGRVRSVGRVPDSGAASHRGSSVPLVVFVCRGRGIRCRGFGCAGAAGSFGVFGFGWARSGRRFTIPGSHVFWS